ncbi:JAB domain-containing protein [Sphingobacterium paucimobilis]|nr:JAB domain-containing protein [Sphingobacterium paucimobilis]
MTSSKDAYLILIDVWKEGLMQFTEEFKVILLNSANRVLGIVDIAKGGKDYVPVDMKLIFSIALKASASKIILAHNHPSGSLVPSSADKQLTQKSIEASKVLDIEICDHIIVSNEGYFSFRDDGLM